MIIYGIPISTVDLWLLGACGTLLLVLIRLRFVAEIRKRDIFNQAAKDFVAAFQNELIRLKFESTSTYDIIKPAMIKHGEACATFRRFLRGRALDKFDSARRIYFVSTPPCPDNEDDPKYQDERTAIIERIEELLDFAKYK